MKEQSQQDGVEWKLGKDLKIKSKGGQGSRVKPLKSQWLGVSLSVNHFESAGGCWLHAADQEMEPEDV